MSTSAHSSTAQKATIRRVFDDVVNGDDLAQIEDIFHPDCHFQTPHGPIDREGFKAFVTAWREGFADLTCEVGDMVAEGDLVSWEVRATGTHTGTFNGLPATGRRVDFVSLNLARFEGSQVIEHRVVMDLLTMLTQLGAIPERTSP